MKYPFLSATILAAFTLSGAMAAPPEGKGKGEGKDEEPGTPIEAAYVFTLSGKPSTLNIANRDFTETKTVLDMNDGRTRGLDHAPDEGRALTEEHRALWESRYVQKSDGSVTVSDRIRLHNGELSADKVQCIATAIGGRTAYSLTSTTSKKLEIFGPHSATYYFQGGVESCDFKNDGTSIALVENLSGPDSRLVRINLPGGEPEELLYSSGEEFYLKEIDVAPDGQSYLLSWADLRSGTTVGKVSEWKVGDNLLLIPEIASDAGHAAFACDYNADGIANDGYIYLSTAGRNAKWVERTSAGERELYTNKGGNFDQVYWLRPAC